MSIPSAVDEAEWIRRLVEVCRAGQSGYALAGKAVSDPVLRAELLQYSGQREEFVAELHQAVRAGGVEPHEPTSVAHSPVGQWPGISAVIASGNRGDLLEKCEQAEAEAVDTYRLAVSSGLPAPLKSVIHAQYLALSRVKDRIQILARHLRDESPATTGDTKTA